MTKLPICIEINLGLRPIANVLMCLLFVFLLQSCTKGDEVIENQITVDTDSLSKVLQFVYERDRDVRNDYRNARIEHGEGTPVFYAAQDSMFRADKANQTIIEEFISCYGYPTKERFGKYGPRAAFLVLQHSPMEAQRKYYHLVKESADSGNLRMSSFALFEDRMRMRLGYPQIYGSQIDCQRVSETMQCRLFPLAAQDKVDSLRATVGLGPLGEYLSKMGVLDNRFN